MYKVLSIDNDEMTKNIELKNTKTGTIDMCFDDSALVSDRNFDFMKVGGEYKCKIKLFGNVAINLLEKTVLCKVVDKDIIVGTKKMVKVLVEDDEYYIPAKKLNDFLDIKEFYFRYTRKDLIEVDNTTHADLL
jgi:hypothetical protein